MTHVPLFCLAVLGSAISSAELPLVPTRAGSGVSGMLLAANRPLGLPMARRGTHTTASGGRSGGSAVQEPRSDFYVNAVQVYPWSDGVQYILYTAPERVSEIALEAGESLVAVAAGDTARWVIGDTASGTGAARRMHVLVKPMAAGLRTNLIITTDRRLYRVQVASRSGPPMAGIAWIYPEDQLMALNRAESTQVAAQPVAAGMAVEALNFGYAISGDKVSWRPIRAFDDGRQVFIQFPASLAQDQAPPLFLLGERGRAELINYRVRGRYYVVDRLFGTAELRLGARRQQVVRISRTGDGASRPGAKP